MDAVQRLSAAARERRQLLRLPSAHEGGGQLMAPSARALLNYGKTRKFGEAETKAVYEKVYNAHATYPCSNMPRFGTNKILTVEQIKDLVALVMSPDSPVNK
jgi:mono/diheme cytochrome c family protein